MQKFEHFNSLLQIVATFLFVLNQVNLATTIDEDDFAETFSSLGEDSLDSSAENALETSLVSKDPDDIQFYLFPNKLSPNMKQEIVYGDTEGLKRSKFVRGESVIIYVHGFMVNVTTGGCQQLKSAYLKQNYANIICVDWGKLSGPNQEKIPMSNPTGFLFYPLIVKNTVIVATRLAEFLDFLVDNKVVEDFDRFHLLGHSLGAHIVGTAGGQVLSDKRKKVGRITGLDPAGPLYQLIPAKYKLDKSKANYVDVIHTDTELFGTPKVLGNADYFANGGKRKNQPGCKNVTTNIIQDLACGHLLAIDYYERGILGEKLSGCKCKYNPKAKLVSSCPKPKKCDDDQPFGPNVVKRSGTFFLPIPRVPPKNIRRDYIPLPSLN